MRIRKILSLCLAVLLCCPALPVLAAGYTAGQFSDVDERAWYGESGQQVIRRVCELGLMQGRGKGFAPDADVTLAEAVAMAARLRHIQDGGDGVFKQGKVWYQIYIDYALEKGIIRKDDFSKYEREATRAEMAYIFANALPAASYAAINTVDRLPDVTSSTPYAGAIFLLYRAGVLTGNDSAGTFTPSAAITRAQAAAIITRSALPAERKTLSLTAAVQPAEWSKIYSEGKQITSAAELAILYESALFYLMPSFSVSMASDLYRSYSDVLSAAGGGRVAGENVTYDAASGRFTIQLSYTALHEITTLWHNPVAQANVSLSAKQYAAQIEALAEKLTEGLSKKAGAAAIHDYMIKSYTFGAGLSTSGNPREFSGLLDSGAGSGNAFAELFYLLCDRADIPCALVFGSVKNASGAYTAHSWNTVTIEGTIYHVDTASDDALSTETGLSQKYFLKTDSDFKKDHSW